MKALLASFFVVVICTFSPPQLAAEVISPQENSAIATAEDATSSVSQAQRSNEALEQDIALALAPIKSRRELVAYLRSTPKSSSPLEFLSTPAKNRFLESLTFNEKGITGFRHDDLQAELSASQIYRVLSLFGAQHTTRLMKRAKVENALDEELLSPSLFQSGPLCPSQPCDYEGYRCEGEATCAQSINTICMRNC